MDGGLVMGSAQYRLDNKKKMIFRIKLKFAIAGDYGEK